MPHESFLVNLCAELHPWSALLVSRPRPSSSDSSRKAPLLWPNLFRTLVPSKSHLIRTRAMSESEKIPLKSDERIEDDYDAESVCSKAGSTSTQEVTWDAPKFRHEERRRSAKNNLMTALNVFCLVLSSILFASSFISGDEAQNWAYRQVSYDCKPMK